MRNLLRLVLFSVVLLGSTNTPAQRSTVAPTPTPAQLETRFGTVVKPFLQTYCVNGILDFHNRSRVGTARSLHFAYGVIVSIDPSGRYFSSVTLMLRRFVTPPDICVSW
jgi:hypothetical protein